MLKILVILSSLFISSFCFAESLVMKVIPLNNRFAADIQPLISPFLEGSERIIANRSNLIVKASPSRQIEIKNLIERLDQRLQNLTISVIQSRSETAQSLNASLHFKRRRQLLNRPKNNIQGRFANTEVFDDKNSQQSIQTLDGRPAYIKTGKIHPINRVRVSHSDFGHTTISSNTELIEATTGFMVTPRLSGSQVILEITPWSDKMNYNGILQTQRGHSTVRVSLGKWVEIGGIDEQSQQSAKSILSRTYSTRQKSMKILVKVERNQPPNYLLRGRKWPTGK